MDRLERLAFRLIYALLVILAAWFWFGVVVAPWAVTVGPWWPASVILFPFAAVLTGCCVWFRELLRG